MTFYFIKENSRMWKTQRYKSYGMTIDTNSYEKTKDTNCYEISRGFWFTTSNIWERERERERERESISSHCIPQDINYETWKVN